MNTNTFYSGDLSAINQNQVAANDSNTREQDSLRRYLASLAQVGSEDRRTGAYERAQGRDADVRLQLGRGAIDNTRLGISTNERLAMLRNAIDEKLGMENANVARYGIDTGAKTAGNQFELGKMQIDAQKALQEMLGNQALKQIQAGSLWGTPSAMTGRMGEATIGAMTDASASNAASEAAAARGNASIPAAADELGGTPWRWDTDYLKALNPGGDQILRSTLLNRVLKNMGADASLVQIGPGGTNFVPVLRQGVNPALMLRGIDRINQETANAIRAWDGNTNAAVVIPQILARHKQLTGQDFNPGQ